VSDGCRLGCCTPEVAALPDGGWTTSDKGWKLDDRRREHVAREWREKSAQIDRMQADYPKCKLCGQAALRLDVAGLCSKIDEAHKAYRVRLGLPAVPAAPVPQRGRR
jgi:hypothetical protein